MFCEVGVPLLAGIFLEINALTLMVMIVMFFVHEATALWDVSYAVTARRVTSLEQPASAAIPGALRPGRRRRALCLATQARPAARGLCRRHLQRHPAFRIAAVCPGTVARLADQWRQAGACTRGLRA
jgi:hypothetical protein